MHRSAYMFLLFSLAMTSSIAHAKTKKEKAEHVEKKGKSETGKKGKTYPKEWKILPAYQNGYEVLQLTTHKALDNKFYLKVNPYVKSLNAMAFVSDRGGARNIYLMSMKTGEITQITAHDSIRAEHGNVSAATEEVFFNSGKTIYAVSLRAPYEERTVGQIDRPYRVSGEIGVSTDGKTLALSLYDEAKDKSTVATMNAQTGALKKIHDEEEKGRVDHVSINPQLGSHLLYHVFGLNKVVVVDIASGKATTITEPGDHGVHSFWFSSGKRAAYVLKGAKGAKSKEQIVTYDWSAKTFTRYDVPTKGNHFAVNTSDTMLQGDGSPNDKNIYYFPIEGKKLGEMKMAAHNSSSSSELWHPHAHFINETDLVFGSDADGNGNIYLLRKKK